MNDAGNDAQNDAGYSPRVIEHFERPRNIGHFAPGERTIAGAAGQVAQGAMFALSARVAGGHIEALRFEVYGCPHCVAAGSWLSERLVGAARADLERWSWREAGEALDIPAAKYGRLLILEDAVRALAAALGQGRVSPGA